MNVLTTSCNDWGNVTESGRCQSMAEDQHGRAARGGVGGGGALRVGQAGGEGAHPRRAVRDDGWHRSMRCAHFGNARRQGVHGESGRRRYGATIKDALIALWRRRIGYAASAQVMIPTLLPALERHGRLKLDQADRDPRSRHQRCNHRPLLGIVKVARAWANGARAGFYSHPARGSDSHVQRLERPAAGLLRGRTWSHMAARRWRARSSDADNGRCRHGLDPSVCHW